MSKKKSKSSDITRMSTLLLSGATMLADSCPDCNVPLFKKDNDIFCPNCNRKAIYVKSDDEIKQIEHKQSYSETVLLLQDVLNGKLNFLGQNLASCETLDEMKHILQLMELIVDLMAKISK
jgi:UPF0148 protein